MTPDCAAAFVSLSAFQVGAICVITCASIALTWLLGVAEGRAREACEPTQQITEEGGE